MSQPQLRNSPPLPDPGPGPPAGPGARPARLAGLLGRYGPVAAGYAVFLALVGLLAAALFGDVARYSLAAVSGAGTGVAAWLGAALLRARSEPPPDEGRAPRPRTGGEGVSGGGPLPALCAAAHATLTASVTVVDDPRLGRLTGWSHALDEPSEPTRPTPMGTAYGLHILLELGLPDGRLKTSDLVDTLWRLRLPEGGWAARSQGAVARPEVTALVLGALARAGADAARLAAEAERCAGRFTRELEPAGLEMTHVVTTVLRGLLRTAPDSAVLPRLREALVDGAVTDPLREHRRCWGSRLAPLPGRPVAVSPVHTAQAVVALDRMARVLGEGVNERATRQDGVRWLLSCPGPAHDCCDDLENTHEALRRPHPTDAARREVLSVRLFTAAWVLRALLTEGARELAAEEGLLEQWRERVAGAADAVWRQQSDGIWAWDGDVLAYPLWMTYQGLSALRAHALCMYQPDV